MAATSRFIYVPATVASWEQHPEYVDICREQYLPGDLHTYTPAHVGSTPSDYTSFKYGLSRYNEDNLPNIMYQFWPCRAWKAFKKSPRPPPKLDSHGNPMLERHPRPNMEPRTLLDFPILRGIDKIATDAPAWLLEMWMRLDPRLKWEDIDMRMKHAGQRRLLTFRGFKNSCMNNKTARYRQRNLMISWRDRLEDTSSKARDSVLAQLSPAQLNANSTHPSLGSPAAATTGLQTRKTTTSLGRSNTSNRSSRPARPSSRSARPSTTHTGVEFSDEEDSEGNDLEEIPEPVPKPKRGNRGPANYMVDAGEDDKHDSATSDFEPEPESSRSGRSKKTPTAETWLATQLGSSQSGKTKRVLDAEQEVPNNKKQRISRDNAVDETLIGLSFSQPPRVINTATHANRRHKQVERVRDSRRHRAAPHATSSALELQTPPSSPILTYRFDATTSCLMATQWLQTTSLAVGKHIYQPPTQDSPEVSSESCSYQLWEPPPLPPFEELNESSQDRQGTTTQALLFPDAASRSSEWKAFIIDHNAEPILKAHIWDDWLEEKRAYIL